MSELTPAVCEICGGSGKVKPTPLPETEPTGLCGIEQRDLLYFGRAIPADEPCPACTPPMPRKGSVYDVVFAVDITGQGWLIGGSAEVLNYVNEGGLGASMEDCGFTTQYPEEPGVYRAKAKFHVFECGSYYEREWDTEFELIDAQRIPHEPTHENSVC